MRNKKRLTYIQKGILFGKPIDIDIRKNIEKQPWYKGNLFSEDQKQEMYTAFYSSDLSLLENLMEKTDEAKIQKS